MVISDHRGAFDYDWRTRFHLPLEVVGDSMPWDECLRLTHILAADPSAQVSAALSGMQYPVTREVLVLMDLFDLQHTSKSKRRPKPYPRPKVRQARSLARQALIEKRLRSMGHGDLLDRIQ